MAARSKSQELMERVKPRKGKGKKRLLPIADKYIVEKFKLYSPYMKEGITIEKKLLNPYYAHPDQARSAKLKGALRADHADHEFVLARSAVLHEKSVPRRMGSIERQNNDNKYSHVKSKYMDDKMNGYLQMPAKWNSNYYYYDCCTGNNGRLVMACINSRPWWRDHKGYKKYGSPLNFIWTQGNWSFEYDQLTPNPDRPLSQRKVINRYQHGYEINDKSNLYRNLWFYLTAKSLDPCTIVPLTFSFRAE